MLLVSHTAAPGCSLRLLPYARDRLPDFVRLRDSHALDAQLPPRGQMSREFSVVKVYSEPNSYLQSCGYRCFEILIGDVNL